MSFSLCDTGRCCHSNFGFLKLLDRNCSPHLVSLAVSSANIQVDLATLPMVRTRNIHHARLACRAENLRLQLVIRGFLPPQSGWYFQYPVECRNNYSRPPPAALPHPTSLVFVSLTGGQAQINNILFEGCIHSCQYDCPRCRVTDPDSMRGRTGPGMCRDVCILWNHLPELNGVALHGTCPAPPDPSTGCFHRSSCLHCRD